MRDDTTKVVGSFLLGGVLGAAVALLYAPKSGRETRKDIADAGRRIKKSAIELADDTIEDMHDFAAGLREKAKDIIEHGADLSDKAKEEIVTALELGQKAIEKEKRKLAKALGL
ncbi:MAG: YtxH domain-containing protein [Nitrospirae bacterium]|nr:MAG: YtxH domain-containing protein [Nitrospirota bacterium]